MVDVDGLVCVVDTGSDVDEGICIEVVSKEVAKVVVEGLPVEQSSHCAHSPVASSKIKSFPQTQEGWGISNFSESNTIFGHWNPISPENACTS